MGLCFSCCLHSGNDSTTRRAQPNGQVISELEDEYAMDECGFPAQFSLGQNFPRTNTTLTSNSLPAGSISANKNHNGELQTIGVPWYSPVPISRTQLNVRRNEFWETAPAYGGCPEIWQAICEAIDVGHKDLETARTILACAGVTIPSGHLTEAYDDRGYRYVIPTYCLCDPVNDFIEEDLDEPEQTTANFSDLSPFNSYECFGLLIRVSNGDDIKVSVPSSPAICIGHLKTILGQEITDCGRIELFWAGHGPLSDVTKLSSIKGLQEPDKGMMQAWVFPGLQTTNFL